MKGGFGAAKKSPPPKKKKSAARGAAAAAAVQKPRPRPTLKSRVDVPGEFVYTGSLRPGVQSPRRTVRA